MAFRSSAQNRRSLLNHQHRQKGEYRDVSKTSKMYLGESAPGHEPPELTSTSMAAPGVRADTKLELMSESVLGQERSFSPIILMAALGCKADSISDGRGVCS